ncbi:MAG TPA: hypothetical protein VEG39_16275 [Clostridia bacterium]|nr:hypothetical protein [Clostridia bacterium]
MTVDKVTLVSKGNGMYLSNIKAVDLKHKKGKTMTPRDFFESLIYRKPMKEKPVK